MNIQAFHGTRHQRFGMGGNILRSREALSDEQIQGAAPSIFAQEKHESRSDRYTYIPTSEVLRGMRAEGFLPYEVRQGGSKDQVKRGFMKHMVRFRREGDIDLGDSVRELILINSHDGTSSYQLMSGVFRMVCTNGMIVADAGAKIHRVRHTGNVVHEVIEGSYQVLAEGAAVAESIGTMRALELRPREQEAFAEAAMHLRYQDESKPDVTPDQINRARRTDDQGNDMWHVFNRVQENLVRGGLHYVHRNAQGQRSRRETRPVNSIDGDTALNRALWTLASRMQELK